MWNFFFGGGGGFFGSKQRDEAFSDVNGERIESNILELQSLGNHNIFLNPKTLG